MNYKEVFNVLIVMLIMISYIVAAPFTEEWNKTTSINFYYESGGNKADFTHTSGVISSIEPSTKILSLKTDPTDKPGAWQGPNMTSNNLCSFGTYAARIKIPDASSQPNVGSVVGFYTYYNDEYNSTLSPDINKNGIYDNSEIDFEWLIADPQIIYITAYTDFSSATQETRSIGRIINLAKGIIYETSYKTSLDGKGVDLSGVENLPETITAIPNYDASKQFYTYGFDWHPESIRWWIIHPETKDTVVLWNYQGPVDRITQKDAYLMLNIWHTSDWPVQTNPLSTEAPNKRYSVEFDWVSYTPIKTIDIINRPEISHKQQISYKSEVNGNTLVINSNSLDGGKSIEIFTASGQLVKKINFSHSTDKTITIPLNDISVGHYLWSIKTEIGLLQGSFLYQ